MFLFDPHVHTAETSACGRLPAEEIVDRSREQILARHYRLWAPDFQEILTAEKEIKLP